MYFFKYVIYIVHDNEKEYTKDTFYDVKYSFRSVCF